MTGFLLDSASVGEQARTAAAIPDPKEGIAALTRAFERCGSLAGDYPDPDVVVSLLVSHVAEEWQAVRAAISGRRQ